RILIGVTQQQFVELLLVRRYLRIDLLGARIDSRGAAACHGAHLLLGGRATGDSRVVLVLQVLQLGFSPLQAREITAATLVGDVADVGFLEFRQLLLRLVQSFGVV